MDAAQRAPFRRRTRAVARLELDEMSRKRQRIASAKEAAAAAAAAATPMTIDEGARGRQMKTGPSSPPNAVSVRARAGRGLKRRPPPISADAPRAAHSSPPPVPTRRGGSTPVKVGAAFGDNLPVETTPTKTSRPPSAMARMEPTPEKTAVPTPPDTAADDDAEARPPDAARASKKAAASVARGIAQSGSSSAARKRMISFSPERSPRPENRALALRKLEKNLKANEKLQMRLEGTPVKTPAKGDGRSHSHATPSPASANARRSVSMMSPATATAQAVNTRASPAKSPGTAISSSMPLSQTMELTYEALSQEQEKENAGASTVNHAADTADAVEAAKDAPADEQQQQQRRQQRQEEEGDPVADGMPASQSDGVSAEVALSQGSAEHSAAASAATHGSVDARSVSNYAEPLPPAAELERPMTQSQSESNEPAMPSATAGSSSVWADNADVFTSTSVIEDVGLFNCDTDVEYTGGVYGEGTDGKVRAAVIGGQKVALKRAKPHEGFPEEEAKRRSAVELHYLRRVRHMKGFLQCLGLCDGIEHTCIALEVMDCKLSDYLRNYGVALPAATATDASTVSAASVSALGAVGAGGGRAGSKKRRRFTLPVEDARAMLRQICLPMITLHDHVNVAHGDLACRNILLRTPPKGYEKSFAPEVKLSDFGRVKLPSSEPRILEKGFSFFKNCDIGSFGREVLYRLLVGEIVPPSCLETRSLHKHLTDVVVTSVPEPARQRLGPFYRLFLRCTGWGVRPSFREIYDHLDDLEHFELSDNGLFPLKPGGSSSSSSSAASHTPSSDASAATGPGFVSPVALGRKPSSASKVLREAPTPHGGRSGAAKAVNWLKTRSVRAGPGAPPAPALTPSAPRQQQLLGRQTTKKKTPPSASRRALQIVNQIRSMGVDGGDRKGRKSV